MRRLPVVLLATALLVPGCGVQDPSEPDGVRVLGAEVERVRPQAADEELRALGDAQLAFALDVYRAASDQEGDLVLGAANLHALLSMLRLGARGHTAQELDDVLGATALDGRLQALTAALDDALRERDTHDDVDLATAARIWSDDGLVLREEFVRALAETYGAGLAELDLTGDPESARSTVNAWVAEHTAGRIEELFPEGSIDSSTVLVLAAALRLDAAWRFPFPSHATRVQPFTLTDGTTARVETMHYDEYLPSGSGPDWQAVRLPYAGEELSMTIVVPHDLAAFEQRLDPALLASVESGIRDGGIHLALPRFTASSDLSLVDVLAELGAPSAMTPGADFSGMSEAGGLHVAALEHEAVVEVDEQGTEAAAGSGAGMAGSHGPTVLVDRPFLFVVRDLPTGAVLFLGRVTDPR